MILRSIVSTIVSSTLAAIALLLVSQFSEANTPLELAERDGVFPRFATYQHDYQPRAFFNAKLEPEQGIIHGAGQDEKSFREYASLFPQQHQPVMTMSYVTLVRGLENVKEWHNNHLALKDQPVLLQIGVNLTAGRDDGTGSDKAVANGEYDDAIDTFVEALKDLNVPTYLRIGYEFEGEWNNYSPETYVVAFKRITDKVRAAGLDNIATVWCSAGGSAGFVAFDRLMAFYPGDDYVDWWSVDVFSPEEIPHPWLGEFYDLAGKHKKPVMIGENTPRYVGANKGWHSWIRWYKPFFEMVRKHPEIKAISYINWDWVYWSNELGFEWHDWEDARLQTDELVSELYVHELSHPIWLHAKDIRKIALEK